jgi:hypothetical protein
MWPHQPGTRVPLQSAHVKTFKLHDDLAKTVNAALEKAKASSGTSVDSVAFEYICLDFLGGQTFAARARAIGPISGANGIKAAYQGEALVAFLKEFGVEELQAAISAAASNP